MRDHSKSKQPHAHAARALAARRKQPGIEVGLAPLRGEGRGDATPLAAAEAARRGGTRGESSALLLACGEAAWLEEAGLRRDSMPPSLTMLRCGLGACWNGL